MIENYLNKEAQITIAFANDTIDGGASPMHIIGKATNVDDTFISIEFDQNRKENKFSFKNTSGKMLVRKEYVISIVLL